MNNYYNELLCQSKPEIMKVWNKCWEEITSLDPVKEYEKVAELNKEFDKCVEAYHAVDCGTYWIVRSASRVRGKYRTYKVEKEA